jgi:hypothetical protein
MPVVSTCTGVRRPPLQVDEYPPAQVDVPTSTGGRVNPHRWRPSTCTGSLSSMLKPEVETSKETRERNARKETGYRRAAPTE